MSISTMSIVAVPRSAEIAQLNQNDLNRVNVEQTNAQTTVEKQAAVNSENVVAKDNALMHDGNFDAKEKGQNEYEYVRAKKKKKEEEDGKVVVKSGFSGFDMKI